MPSGHATWRNSQYLNTSYPTARERLVGRTGQRPILLIAVASSVLVALALFFPLVALIDRASSHIGTLNAQERQTARDAIRLSAETSLISLAVILVAGTPFAYLLGRHRFRGRALLDTLVDLPMILPPAVAGLALLMAFGRRGVLGEYLNDIGIQIGFSTSAVIIAQIFVASPFYLRSAAAAFSHVPHIQEEAASDLGAGPVAVLRTITLPSARSGLLAGAVLCWARAVGEFGATIMFAGNLPRTTQTLPLAIYGRFEAGDLNTSLVMALILLVSSGLVLLSVRGIGTRVRVPATEE